MSVDMRLGQDKKRLSQHKEGSTTWACTQGHLSYAFLNAPADTLSACGTLALYNLLHVNLEDIVQAAKKEQRKIEEANLRNRGGAIYHAPKGKS